MKPFSSWATLYQLPWLNNLYASKAKLLESEDQQQVQVKIGRTELGMHLIITYELEAKIKLLTRPSNYSFKEMHFLKYYKELHILN